MNGNLGKSLVNLRRYKQRLRLQYLLFLGPGAGLSLVSCSSGGGQMPSLGDDGHFVWCPECLRRYPGCLRPRIESVYRARRATKALAVSTG